MSKFWTFDQNNSGGGFDFQPNDGITHFVIIEANDQMHAMQRAIDIGIYFNGVDTDTDCPCCGDRWSEPWNEGTDSPQVFSHPANDYRGWQWMADGKEICVHYLDGRKEWFGVVK